MSVGFTAAAIRKYVPIFEKAVQMASSPLADPSSHLLTSFQISEQFEDASSVPINVCPILSHATLGTMSEGESVAPARIPALTPFPAVLGYSTDDMGEEFISNNIQIMCVTVLPELELIWSSTPYF
jgi:hypothetical protein